MSTIHVLLIGNDSVLEIDRLKNEVSGAFLNAASAAVTLQDTAGTAVAGASWPKQLDYVTASDGLYRCTLPAALVLTANARYTALVEVSAAGLTASWRIECVARTRG